ncbi:MAG: type II toxin-antitoxin system ParD family antitoxin [Acidobacteriales bacterium]|nr:type II toxin-antitoxin system ParD family antitoxin [Terriglobales bacterium]
MDVSLTPELKKFVDGMVQAGRYRSASEVVREALRLLEEQEQARVLRLREFNQKLGHRLAALDRGEYLDAVEARALLRRKSEERRKKRA